MRIFYWLLWRLEDAVRWITHPRDTVSREWLFEYERREEASGIDGPCFRWPINKLRDSSGDRKSVV